MVDPTSNSLGYPANTSVLDTAGSITVNCVPTGESHKRKAEAPQAGNEHRKTYDMEETS